MFEIIISLSFLILCSSVIILAKRVKKLESELKNVKG